MSFFVTEHKCPEIEETGCKVYKSGKFWFLRTEQFYCPAIINFCPFCGEKLKVEE